MVNIKIKNEQFFTIERSEGSLDYPRYYYASKISDYAFDIKSIGAEQTKLLSFALMKSVTIEGVEFTEIHDFISAINGILYNGASGSGSTTAITDKLQELIELTQSENDQTQELLTPKIAVQDDQHSFVVADGTYTVAQLLAGAVTDGYAGGKTKVHQVQLIATPGSFTSGDIVRTAGSDGEMLRKGNSLGGSELVEVDEFTTVVADGGCEVHLVLF